MTIEEDYIEDLKIKLDKAIKALEKYANTDNWMGFENDGDSELWCNEFLSNMTLIMKN